MLDRGLARVRDTIESNVKRGRMSEAEGQKRLDGLKGSLALADLGDAVGVFLSQTEYRTNRGTEGEVHLDRTQVQWLEKQLTQAHAPTFVFSHAPILGSGIRILQEVHLRHPNAWLNHADGAEQFQSMVRRSPLTRLWFSGHNHLGQNYVDSVTTVGNCTFVHVGVIGSRSRDGLRQSRVLKYNRKGWRLFSLDHTTGDLRADFECHYDAEEVRCLFSPTDTSGRYFPPPPMPTGSEQLMIGRSVFLLHRGMLLEYNAELAAPLGVVATEVDGWKVTCEGGHLIGVGPDGMKTIFKPNPWGWFFKVHSPNPYLNNQCTGR